MEPQRAADGRILYARWDYVDRHRMWHMGLWSTLPSGFGPAPCSAILRPRPYSMFEARSIPNSSKIIFTASAHHSHAGGSLVLLDTTQGLDGPAPMTRLTPEVAFPEIEGWSDSYYANPFPLSEDFYLVAWSPVRLAQHASIVTARRCPVRSIAWACTCSMPSAIWNCSTAIRTSRACARCRSGRAPARRGALAGRLGRGAGGRPDAATGRLSRGPRRHAAGQCEAAAGRRAATQDTAQHELAHAGRDQDDPGKIVLGTVPVEADGSAYFRVPAGMPLFLQALDERGRAVQTMRSACYVHPIRPMRASAATTIG